ncbi:MAG: two-component system chemotaxis response regulator CheY, partial [Lysobacterales bacterium]
AKSIESAKLECEILQAVDGEEGLRLLTENRDDIKLILLDWQMPNIDGLEFMKAVVNVPEVSAIPIIMITASNTEDNRNMAYSVNPDLAGYLTKPCRPNDLIEAVKTVLYIKTMANDFSDPKKVDLEKYVDNIDDLLERFPDIDERFPDIDELLERFPDIDELYIQALFLTKIFKRVLKSRTNFKFSSEPYLERVPIIEFRKRMRVWGLEKFKNTTYLATINFFRTEKDRAEDVAVGALVLYIGEEYVLYLLRRLGYPDIEEEPEEMEEACGTLLNLVAGNFKTGLVQLGYEVPIMSHFTTGRNEMAGGVAYEGTQIEKYEISIELSGTKTMVLDLTMGHLDKK